MLLLYRTRFGRSIRATMQDQTAARLIGINVNRVAALTFGIGVAVTAVGGMVFGATSGGFNPNSGYDLISRLLAIIILGGLGSIAGALVAAVFMTTTESLVDIWSPDWAVVVFYAALVSCWRSAHPACSGGRWRGHSDARRRQARPPARRRRPRVVLAVLAVFPLVVHQRNHDHYRRGHADLRRGRRRPGTFSPAIPATSRSAHAVFFGAGAYTVGIAARDWQLNGTVIFATAAAGGGGGGGALAVPSG